MISYRVKIPNSLKIKLSSYNMTQVTKRFTNKIGLEALRNVREFGIGTAGGNTNPTGGAPVWQGKVGGLGKTGHYRGYLSDSHYLKQSNSNEAQVVTTADFAEGVIIGISTNWFDKNGNPVTFPPNRYHKRAVDKLYANGIIYTAWRNSLKGSIT